MVAGHAGARGARLDFLSKPHHEVGLPEQVTQPRTLVTLELWAEWLTVCNPSLPQQRLQKRAAPHLHYSGGALRGLPRWVGGQNHLLELQLISGFGSWVRPLPRLLAQLLISGSDCAERVLMVSFDCLAGLMAPLLISGFDSKGDAVGCLLALRLAAWLPYCIHVLGKLDLVQLTRPPEES
mmetsp:Transcript_75397/g.140646  ORF Transcript_75397/g.140646 Transcript_75397/m.140646 type:complete len:181 (+) Transcript_75397:1151-1693(+)